MLAALSRWMLGMFGWRVIGAAPEEKKYIIIVAPHTSNWDFFVLYLTRTAFRLKPLFLIKDAFFKWYCGWLFRWLGGLPIDRSARNNVVDQVAQFFHDRERLVLALTPEGTRKKMDHWKSGFYHMARAAGVPIALVYIDASTKTVGFGPTLRVGDDLATQFATIRGFYGDKRGIRPELESDIRPRHA